jgi:uncharacterized protein (TIGR04222 family)
MNVTGPVFLTLYLSLTFVVNIWLRFRFRSNESDGMLRQMDFAQDPYQIAFLRAGADEATKVAVVSLVDRGLLEESNGILQARRDDAGEFVRRPIEKAILQCFSISGNPDKATTDAQVLAACNDYETQLQQNGMLANNDVYRQRFKTFATVSAIMIGISVWRIAYALMHGKSNIWLLIFLTVICTIALYVPCRNRLTGMGEATLKRLKNLFNSLKQRAASVRSGGENQDAALLAALFGLATLPDANFPFVERLYPKPVSSSDSDSGSSSSDGGGGCGGGCGGCS